MLDPHKNRYRTGTVLSAPFNLNPSLRTVKKMGKALMVLRCRQRRETERGTADRFPGSHPAFSSNTYGTFWLPEAPSPFVSSNHVGTQSIQFTFCPPDQSSYPVPVHFRSAGQKLTLFLLSAGVKAHFRIR